MRASPGSATHVEQTRPVCRLISTPCPGWQLCVCVCVGGGDNAQRSAYLGRVGWEILAKHDLHTKVTTLIWCAGWAGDSGLDVGDVILVEVHLDACDDPTIGGGRQLRGLAWRLHKLCKWPVTWW